MDYKGKKVLVTGNTGFKGAWMTKVLMEMGANVYGYSLAAPTSPSLFHLLKLDRESDTFIKDIRDLDSLLEVFKKIQPEIVIHMAAQPIVRESYKNPVYTYETNVMGTVNVLESIRLTDSVRSFVNVTTDKVYKNREWAWGYRENEELNGYDPYSNSKSCSELVTSSYTNSFFGKDSDRKIAISTCRAGNVIGGGDFAVDRIIPDCVRAAKNNKDIVIRNPYSTRPYQHVLEPVMTYLELADRQLNDMELAGNYNIGPEETDCVSTGVLADMFCEKWSKISGEKIKWVNKHDGGPHEASFLKLDCSKIKNVIGWRPTWNIDTAVEKSVEWYYEYENNADVVNVTEKEIKEFIG